LTLVLLLGGARSGKSRLAIERARAHSAPVTFIATGEAGDAEMAERIELHKHERPKEWTTVEEPRELTAALAAVPAGDTAIVDCLSLWVANVGTSAGAEDAVRVAATREGLTVVVSNEVGLGIVPDNALARRYRDDLGRVNALWVDAADEAYLVVAGKRMRLE
jgi:adenosyl cobinamide kinase/adenosyl cobinamide phosphate guanylyltransferase